MKDTILLNKNENNKLCSKCGEKYNIEKINNIISNNNKIKDSIYEFDSANSLNSQLNNFFV